MACGATFFPPDVTIRSFLRSVIGQVAVSVNSADVSRVQPAIGLEDGSCSLGPARRLQGQICDAPLRPILGNEGDAIALGQAKVHEAEVQVAEPDRVNRGLRCR